MEQLGFDVDTTAPNFNLRTRRFFLTYKSIIDKHEYITWFQNHLYDLNEYGVCHEIGDTGYEHTHILICTKLQPNIKNSNRFDYNGIHPHIKKINGDFHYNNCFNYLYKFDETPYTNIDPNALGKNGKTQLLITKIQSHNNWRDVMRDEDICHDIRYNLNWAREVFGARTKPAPKCDIKYQHLLKWQKKLYDHFKKPPVDREVVWIYSELPKQGKTTFIKYLQGKMNVLLLNTFKLNDISYLYNEENIIVFDLSFAKSKKLESNLKNYFEDGITFNDTILTCCETLSNHPLLTSSKYAGKTSLFNCHICVLSNCPPTYIDKYLPQRLHVVKAHLDKP